MVFPGVPIQIEKLKMLMRRDVLHKLTQIRKNLYCDPDFATETNDADKGVCRRENRGMGLYNMRRPRGE